MGTVPTGKLERELRKLYLVWLAGLPQQKDVKSYIGKFERDSRQLIADLGGQTASLGAYGNFPVPKVLELSPRADVIYDEMKQAAIKGGIAAGLQATDVARQIVNAGFDGGFRKLNRLARTETVSAYWGNQWNSVAGLDELVMLWSSEFGPKTCDYCIERDGLVVEDESIRDHPNGRCTLVPTLRSRVDYIGTLQADGSITMDSDWTGERTSVEPAEEGDNITSTDEMGLPEGDDLYEGSAQAPEPTPVDTPDWRPTMSRDEAEQWASGSELKMDLLHGTSASAASSIRDGGFTTEKEVYGRMLGNGVYMTENQSVVAMYDHGETMTLKVNVVNPLEMEDIWSNPKFGDVFDNELTGGGSGQAVMARSVTRFANEQGYDGLIKRMPDGSIEELVVFDPKKIVVVK